MGTDLKDHWEKVYAARALTDVSWYQSDPRLSLDLVTQVAPSRSSRIIDVGGGTSSLVDRLVELGYSGLTVLDLSGRALSVARRRLGDQEAPVQWLESDVLRVTLQGRYDVWHDRAVFHFLIDRDDRRRYVDKAARSVRPGGHVIVATFSDGGPTKCSGLDVMTYNPQSLQSEFGDRFELHGTHYEMHETPAGSTQAFVYCSFQTTATP